MGKLLILTGLRRATGLIFLPREGGGQSVPSPSPGRIHIVQRGEDLSKIAPLYGLTLEDLIAANGQIADPDKIDVGDRINIPAKGGGQRVPTPSPSPRGPSPGRIHIVQRGEDLSKIAPLYGLTLEDLIAANGQIADPDKIDVGDRINIPAKGGGQRVPTPSPSPRGPSPGRIHIVQRGEDLSKIAPLYGLTLEDLIAANGQIADPDKIDVGDRINIPSPSSGRIHIVQPGEDLFKIAPLYGLTLDELIAANRQIADPDKIDVGDRINIPAKGGGQRVPKVANRSPLIV